jgi:hypothetical protein
LLVMEAAPECREHGKGRHKGDNDTHLNLAPYATPQRYTTVRDTDPPDIRPYFAWSLVAELQQSPRVYGLLTLGECYRR